MQTVKISRSGSTPRSSSAPQRREREREREYTPCCYAQCCAKWTFYASSTLVTCLLVIAFVGTIGVASNSYSDPNSSDVNYGVKYQCIHSTLSSLFDKMQLSSILCMVGVFGLCVFVPLREWTFRKCMQFILKPSGIDMTQAIKNM